MIGYIDEKIDFIDRCKHHPKFKMSAAHFHDKHEIYYLESGQTKYFVKNELHIVNRGDFIFAPKNEFHQTDCDEINKVERVLVVFDDDFLEEKYIEIIKNLSENNHIKILKEHLSKFSDIFNKMEYEARTKSDDYLEMQKLYIRQLLILLSRYKEKVENKNSTESLKIINDAARYISEHCSEDLSLEALARKYALSPNYFSKLFKEMTGVGLNNYINISRISLAQRLLSSSHVSITKVAEECGFNDSNYFAQVFKKIIGTTPKKYAMQFLSESRPPFEPAACTAPIKGFCGLNP